MAKFKHVTKKYGQNRGVEDLSFTLKPQTITALLGRNGAGKTTTLKLLAGCLQPDAGVVEVDRAKLGFVPEHPPLYREMTVKAYLHFVAALREITPDAQTAIQDVLLQFELDTVKDRIIGHLSKGYQQRLGLAQGAIHHPELLILDEPSSGLDPAQQRQTTAWIRDLSTTKTILISSHSLDEVSRLATRILVLVEGRLRHDINLIQTPMTPPEIGALI